MMHGINKMMVSLREENVGQVSTDYDVDAMWIGVKNAIAEEGVPCGNEKCHQCENLKDAIAVVDRYVDILMGRFEC